MRTLVSAAVALVLCAGTLSAADYKGKVTSVDTTKNTITISVDGKDMTFTVTPSTTFSSPNKKLNEKLETAKLSCKVFTAKKLPTVTITSDDGKKATAIKVGGGKKKGKKKNAA